MPDKRMARNRHGHVLCIGALLLTSGCATVFSNRIQTIRLESIPPGADVSLYQRGQEVSLGTTPYQLHVARTNKVLALVFRQPGLEPKTVFFTRKINPMTYANAAGLFMGVFPGVVGALVDLGTYSCWSLGPTELRTDTEFSKDTLVAYMGVEKVSLPPRFEEESEKASLPPREGYVPLRPENTPSPSIEMPDKTPPLAIPAEPVSRPERPPRFKEESEPVAIPSIL